MRAAAERIDWAELKSKLSASSSAAEEAKKIEKTYRERAARLAERKLPIHAPELVVMTFQMGDERYGIEMSDLKEVLPFRHATPLPGGGMGLVGLINHHGVIRPVVRLSDILGLSVERERKNGYVLMVHKATARVGFLVDDVYQMERVPHRSIAAGTGDGKDRGQLGAFVLGVSENSLIVLKTDEIVKNFL